MKRLSDECKVCKVKEVASWIWIEEWGLQRQCGVTEKMKSCRKKTCRQLHGHGNSRWTLYLCVGKLGKVGHLNRKIESTSIQNKYPIFISFLQISGLNYIVLCIILFMKDLRFWILYLIISSWCLYLQTIPKLLNCATLCN